MQQQAGRKSAIAIFGEVWRCDIAIRDGPQKPDEITTDTKYVNMTDIISNDRRRARRTEPMRARAAAGRGSGDAQDADLSHMREPDDVIALVELFFFAYRDFTGEADAVLGAYGLGRAHHRVLHFVNRRPGIRVADLLEILKITKQSLGRVLRELVQDGWIEQATGADDRRERHLTLTERGRQLATELADLQTRRIETALQNVEAHGVTVARDTVRLFLSAMIAATERERALALIEAADNLSGEGTGKARPKAEKR